ncbi:FMRFamide receptor-like [Mya arenaria]|uniref:FMRFamide receptor-like n=1 Tax=Mya arenaria TaxID=6604 RepID=UPI0022E6A1C0|nr:FMRFamide receptor-like [Mya arenaria]XP_052794017.1 FMRFamide receptor-like [Mya arenaria]
MTRDMYDNTTDVKMNEEILNNIRYCIDGITLIIVIFLGLIGNTLTVIVLTRRVMHTSTNTFLTGLAVWDMIVLLGTLFLINLPQLDTNFQMNVHPYIVAYVYPICLVAQTGTVWITVSFTVERYIAVCHPLKAATMCTVFRAKIVIICVSISALLFNMCRWFEHKPYEATVITDSNLTVRHFNYTLTEFGQDPIFKQAYYFYLYPTVMLFIPLGLLAVLNTLLVLAVRRSKLQQRTMHVRQARENNVTVMLISVVVVFMICQIPALVYNIAYSINSDIKKDIGWEVLSSLRNFLVTFNSAINFLLYCAFGQKFRCIFIRTFFRRVLKDDSFVSVSTPGMTHLMTKLDNKTYRSMLHKGNPCMEMSHTQQTHLSRYSPYSSLTPSPRPSPLPHTRKQPNGFHSELHPDIEFNCTSHLLSGSSGSINTHTPSPQT